MNTVTRERAAEIFLALSAVPPEDRLRRVEELCGQDHELKEEVERLLDGLDLPESFLGSLDTPPSAPGSTVVQTAGTVVGDFVVIRRIGAGGAGVVYLAHQRHPARIVALKVLRQEFVASTVQRRFEIEAELLAQLHHPGIAQIYAAHPGNESTPPYIAMELVNGPPLTEFAEAHGLSSRARIDLVARACDAVQHAHQRGIIHRDLKPGNILVNEDGHPKVLDFGVARTAGAAVSLTTIETQTGELVGTLPYMSPEQVLASPDATDTRTDIHALGVILFRLLTGKLPFGHDDPPMPELARRIAQDDAPKLSAFDPALRGDLEVIVARALAKEKERRYTSAASLATDLRRYLAGQPITASADSAWYQVRRQVRRYRLALGVSAAVAVAVTALAIYANVQRARADRNNLRVQQELATSTIDRGRLISLTSNLPAAEELVWREFFRNPRSGHALWTLWDIYSREPSLWTTIPHEGGTQTLRFSPDGRYLATAGRVDGLIHLVDARSREVLRTFSAQPRSGTVRVLFTPDGTGIVSGSEDGSLRLWDIASGALRREIQSSQKILEDLATVDGVHVATAARGAVKVWSMATGQQVADLTHVAKGVWRVAMSPDGTRVLAGSRYGTVTLMDLARASRLWEQTQTGQTISVAFTPDGTMAASGGSDSLLHVWDASSGRQLKSIETRNGRVRNIAFDRAGSRLVEAGVWRTRVWDQNQPLLPARDYGTGEGVTDISISMDARALATCDGGGGRVRLWDLAADSRTDHWSSATRNVIAMTPVSATGSFSTATIPGVVETWRPGEPQAVRSLNTKVRLYGLAVSDDGRWFVTAGAAGTAAIWDASTGQRAAALPEIGVARTVVLNQALRRLYVGEADGTVKAWDWVDGAARNPRSVRVAGVEVVSIAARAPYVFTGHGNRQVVIRDAITLAEVRHVQGASSPFALAVSEDRRLLAVGTFVGPIDIWDVATGQRVSVLKGQTAQVNAVDFSPDGTLLISASRDGSVRLWDVTAAQWLATIASRNASATRARFFADGRRVAIGYEDGQIEVRDLDYFFRHVAGHAEYQLGLLRAAGETLPRAGEVLDWSRRILSTAARSSR